MASDEAVMKLVNDKSVTWTVLYARIQQNKEQIATLETKLLNTPVSKETQSVRDNLEKKIAQLKSFSIDNIANFNTAE
jgi:hypothetical protein